MNEYSNMCFVLPQKVQKFCKELGKAPTKDEQNPTRKKTYFGDHIN